MASSSTHRYRLGVLLRDGIGPEIVPSSVTVVDAALAAAGADPVEWVQLPIGHAAIDESGAHTPGATLNALAGLDGWLLGPHDSAAYPEPHKSSLNPSSEGFYADRNTHAGTGEFMPTPDVAIAMGIITRPGCERIARSAFELARRRDKRVTIVHKANVLRLTTGLFRDVCREVAAEYPDVTVDDFHIDAMTVHLVRNADRFDVIVTGAVVAAVRTA